jgi:hypothetical protein
MHVRSIRKSPGGVKDNLRLKDMMHKVKLVVGLRFKNRRAKVCGKNCEHVPSGKQS